MNNNFKVAILQLNGSNNLNESLNKGIKSCKKAKNMGAHLAVFPEMWSIGYEMPNSNEDLNSWLEKAIP